MLGIYCDGHSNDNEMQAILGCQDVFNGIFLYVEDVWPDVGVGVGEI